MTTAEGASIIDFLRKEGRGLPDLPEDQEPLRPPLTTNGLAGCCLAGREAPPEVESPWLLTPCFFLRDGLCSVYPVRPFACRSFASTVNCRESGMAEVPEWLLTLAIVTNQLLEALDRGGRWGNMADVLNYLEFGDARGAEAAVEGRLLLNLPSPGLLVMPEELQLVDDYLARLDEMTGLDLVSLGFRGGR